MTEPNIDTQPHSIVSLASSNNHVVVKKNSEGLWRVSRKVSAAVDSMRRGNYRFMRPWLYLVRRHVLMLTHLALQPSTDKNRLDAGLRSILTLQP